MNLCFPNTVTPFDELAFEREHKEEQTENNITSVSRRYIDLYADYQWGGGESHHFKSRKKISPHNHASCVAGTFDLICSLPPPLPLIFIFLLSAHTHTRPPTHACDSSSRTHLLVSMRHAKVFSSPLKNKYILKINQIANERWVDSNVIFSLLCSRTMNVQFEDASDMYEQNVWFEYEKKSKVFKSVVE